MRSKQTASTSTHEEHHPDDSDEDEHDEPMPTTGKAATGKKKKSEDSSARKAQNRIAQREFRQRKQQYIKELETRVEVLSANSDHRFSHLRDVVKALMDENQQLRQLCTDMGSFFAEGLGNSLPRIGMTTELYDAIISRGNSDTALDAFVKSKERIKEADSPSFHDSPSGSGSNSPLVSLTEHKTVKRKRGVTLDDDEGKCKRQLYENVLGIGKPPVGSKEAASSNGGGSSRRSLSDVTPRNTATASNPLPNATGQDNDASTAPDSNSTNYFYPPPPLPTPQPSAQGISGDSNNPSLSSASNGILPLPSYPPIHHPNFPSNHHQGFPNIAGLDQSLYTSHQSSAASPASSDIRNYVHVPSPSTASFSDTHPSLPPIDGYSPSVGGGGGGGPGGRSLSFEFSSMFGGFGFPSSSANSLGRSLDNPMGTENGSSSAMGGGPLARQPGREVKAKEGSRSSGSGNGADGGTNESVSEGNSGPRVARQEEALALIGYHLTNYRKNPSYHLPPSLVPTYLQRTVPHSHMIDGIPIAALRDAMIQAREQFDLSEALAELCGDIEIHGQDVLSGNSWEIPQHWMRKYPMLINEEVLTGANRWRAHRGEPPITLAELKTLESN